MSSQLIKTLITHLPRYAEEEGDFYIEKNYLFELARHIYSRSFS
jgi:hypothetical protein